MTFRMQPLLDGLLMRVLDPSPHVQHAACDALMMLIPLAQPRTADASAASLLEPHLECVAVDETR
jgi:hypothetical protein